jgi:CRP-like cAMP-binding protein
MPTYPKYLRDFPCFGDLSDDQLEAIAQITNAVCYPPNYVLFEEGKPGERLYFLVKGGVDVFYNLGDAGRVRVDNVSGAEIVGCSALVEPYTYTATEISVTEVEVLEIDAASLRGLMQKDCCMGFSIQQQIVRVLLDRVLGLRLGAA